MGEQPTIDIDRLRAWLASPEAKAAIEESRKSAEATMTKLHEARRIDPDELRRPMTI